MKVLLTGGGGFLGGFVIARLLAAGHDVIGLSRSDRTSDHERLRWIPMDLAEGLDTKALPTSIDGVLHLAQSAQYRDGKAGESHVFDVNVAGMAALLRYADDAGASRFVNASTGSVYEPFTGDMSEDALVSPTGFYGASKLSAEMLALAYRSRFSICHMRIFFLYGEGQQNAFVARLINTVRSGEAVTLPASGDGLVFVPTYADDTARVAVTALEDGWAETLNVASPHAVSVRDLARAIGQAFGIDVTFTRNDGAAPAPIVPPLTRLGEKFDLGHFRKPDVAMAAIRDALS